MVNTPQLLASNADRTGDPQLEDLLHSRGVQIVTWEDYLRIQAIEETTGVAQGRPRVKLQSVSEMLRVGRSKS